MTRARLHTGFTVSSGTGQQVTLEPVCKMTICEEDGREISLILSRYEIGDLRKTIDKYLRATAEQDGGMDE